MALDPGFDSYIFIEKDRRKCKELETLKPVHTGASVRIEAGDVNTILQDLCRLNWSQRRAVVFLDPYGMQVDWETLVALSKTQAVDLWLLVPIGIGVFRMLAKDISAIPERWKERLDKMLGTPDWRERFYTDQKEIELRSGQQSLFPIQGDDTERLVRTARLNDVATFYVERLKTIFPAVAPIPRHLYNSQGTELYMLCFAIANPNPKAQALALRIAKHLLSK